MWFDIGNILLRFLDNYRFREINSAFIILICPYNIIMRDMRTQRNCPKNSVNLNLDADKGTRFFFLNFRAVGIVFIKVLR